MDEIHDYRKDTLMPDVPYSYFYPSGSNETNASLETIFSGTELNELNESKESKEEWKEIVPVMMGRKLEVLRANKTCGWFNFKELCHQPLGAADYIAISQRFPVVIIDSVPQLGASYYNEA